MSAGGNATGVDEGVERKVGMKPRKGKPERWLCVEVAASPIISEDVAAEVTERFGIGVEITADGLRFHVEEGISPEEVGRALEEILAIYRPLDPDAPASWRSALVRDENWGEEWKKFFKPLRVGSRFLICPSWEKAEPREGDLLIWMDPGRAFGTGQHETTRLCLEWLDRLGAETPPLAGSSLLDVGTGSGILAMAGALLGCERVVGIDNDPEAIETAEENVEHNGVAGKIQLLEVEIGEVAGTFDTLISNIQALPLIAMATAMCDHLGEGGRLALSGILVEQADAVRKAYEATGLRFVDRWEAGEWCLLSFRR